MTAMRLKRYPSPSGGFALGKMGVGATMLNGWKNPYVTDGLIAMWDGEWNAGGGVHDPNATTWKDLVGTADWLLHGEYSFTGKALRFENNTSGSPSGYGDLTPEQSAIFSEGEATLAIVASRELVNGVLLKTPASCGLGFFNATCFSNSIDPALTQTQLPAGANKVYALTATYSGGRTSGVYVNGESVTPAARDNIGGAQTYATLGYRYSGVAYNYKGSVYEIRLYSRALTADEIARNYAIDKERFNLP